MMLRRYTQTVTDMLSELQKTEESLKKFKKGKKGGPMGSSLLVGTTSNERSMSDEDKIRLQVLLDVKGFGQQVSHHLTGGRGPYSMASCVVAVYLVP